MLQKQPHSVETILHILTSSKMSKMQYKAYSFMMLSGSLKIKSINQWDTYSYSVTRQPCGCLLLVEHWIHYVKHLTLYNKIGFGFNDFGQLQASVQRWGEAAFPGKVVLQELFWDLPWEKGKERQTRWVVSGAVFLKGGSHFRSKGRRIRLEMGFFAVNHLQSSLHAWFQKPRTYT